MRLLIPLDGSLLSEQALEPAMHLLRRAPAPHTVLLVRALTGSLGAQDCLAEFPNPHAALLLDEAVEAMLDYLREVTHGPFLRGITVQSVVRQGDPAQVVRELADECQADLLVLTSHGRTGMVRQTWGQVATHIARASPVPTLLVRPEGQRFPDMGRSEPLTLLVPLDGTALAESAIPLAAHIAKDVRGAIRLLRVVPTTNMSDAVWQRERDAFDELTAWHDRLEAHGIPTARGVAWGDTAAQIVHTARHHRVDTVVIATSVHPSGTRGDRVTEAILHTTRLPVLLTHPPRRSSMPGGHQYGSTRDMPCPL